MLKGIWATTLANEKKLNRAFKVSSLASLPQTFNTVCYILKYQVAEIEPKLLNVVRVFEVLHGTVRLRLEKRFQEWILIRFVLQQVYANITIIVLLLK